jgi:hypothetical protein
MPDKQPCVADDKINPSKSVCESTLRGGEALFHQGMKLNSREMSSAIMMRLSFMIAGELRSGGVALGLVDYVSEAVAIRHQSLAPLRLWTILALIALLIVSLCFSNLKRV